MLVELKLSPRAEGMNSAFRAAFSGMNNDYCLWRRHEVQDRLSKLRGQVCDWIPPKPIVITQSQR